MFSKTKRIQNRKFLDYIKELPCCVCGAWPSDPSHIRSKGAGGPDEFFNVVPKCRKCHTEYHQYGITKFIEKYPIFKKVLRERGWVFNGFGLVHDDLEIYSKNQ